MKRKPHKVIVKYENEEVYSKECESQQEAKKEHKKIKVIIKENNDI